MNGRDRALHLIAKRLESRWQHELLAEVRSASPYVELKQETFEAVLNFIATGGYSLKAYDRFRRLVRDLEHLRLS